MRLYIKFGLKPDCFKNRIGAFYQGTFLLLLFELRWSFYFDSIDQIDFNSFNYNESTYKNTPISRSITECTKKFIRQNVNFNKLSLKNAVDMRLCFNSRQNKMPWIESNSIRVTNILHYNFTRLSTTGKSSSVNRFDLEWIIYDYHIKIITSNSCVLRLNNFNQNHGHRFRISMLEKICVLQLI